MKNCFLMKVTVDGRLKLAAKLALSSRRRGCECFQQGHLLCALRVTRTAVTT